MEQAARDSYDLSIKTLLNPRSAGGRFYAPLFPHMLGKFQIQVTQGQVTRSRQVTSPQKV